MSKRSFLISLAAGGVTFIAVTCNMVSSIPAITPIPTRIPFGTPSDPLLTPEGPLPSTIPDETIPAVGAPSTPIPSPVGHSSQPSSTPLITQASELPPEGSIPTLEAGEPVAITFVRMVTGQHGWGVSNIGDHRDHILRTNDAGETWRDVSPPQAGRPEGENQGAEAFFLDRDTAWVSFEPYESIWFTKDGGNTWGVANTDYAGTLGAKFWFADGDHGWLMIFVDAGMSHVYMALFRTTNGGATWEMILDPQFNDELQSFSKTGMVFVDGETGWVTRDSGGVKPGAFVDVTLDGGITWQSIDLPPPAEMPDKFEKEYCRMHSPTLFSEVSGALIVACISYEGEKKVETAYLFSTSDSGESWERLDYPGGRLQFIDQQVAYALGREIYQTHDGGRSWEQVKRVEWDGQFSFLDENLAWAAATRGEAIALVKTVDGCRTWDLLEPVVSASGD